MTSGSDDARPPRLYVISGSYSTWTPPGWPRPEPFIEPPYPTDPRHYGLPIFKRPLSDEEYARDYSEKCKAFIDREHAIHFGFRFNIDSIYCPVYDWVDGEWVYNAEATGDLADAFI